ncbi:MAG: hypothetical protein JNK82_36290 [Myxococcaceae bacterium]|nr:hypothetical protein [Myxococcaceae bacterium]
MKVGSAKIRRYTDVQMRLLLALLLAFHVAFVPESAEWPCPEDDDAGCEPGCTDCASCGHSALGDVVEVALGVEVTHTTVAEHISQPPLAPEPGDILHVPIARA